MKKIRLISLAAMLLGTSIFCNSCFGPFNLTVKLHSWNSTLGSKWANTAVFFAFIILPVYEACTFLDAFIFNAIEFWGGDNPVSMEEGEQEIKMVRSGKKEYRITASQNRFLIEQVEGPQAGESAEIVFMPEEQSCYLNYRGKSTKIVEYIEAGNGEDQVNLFLPDGSMVAMDAGEKDPEAIIKALRYEANYLTFSDH
jgi:hypothetical protein